MQWCFKDQVDMIMVMAGVNSYCTCVITYTATEEDLEELAQDRWRWREFIETLCIPQGATGVD